jgi:hypothetical protein
MKNSTYSRRSQTVSTVKQVAREDPGGLPAQERPPAGGRPPWRGVQPMAAQRGADHRRRDAHAKAEQLALDALVAPAWVLPGEADDQLLDVLVQRRPAGLVMRVGPRPGHAPPVPAPQRLGRDEEARPAGPGQHPADRGEQRPVAGPEFGSCALAAEHGELVAQDEVSRSLARHRERAARAAGWSGTA